MSEAASSDPLKAKRSDAEDAAIWEQFAGRPVAAIQTGGNVDAGLYARALDRLA